MPHVCRHPWLAPGSELAGIESQMEKVLSPLTDLDHPISSRPDQRLFDQVCSRLRSAIIRGQYAPGARLYERDLTKQLEVSRTPIREALRKLEAEGLVVSFPHRGFFVREPSFDEARQAYEMRRIVESACCELAAQRATEIDLAAMRQTIREAEEALSEGDRESLLQLNKDFHNLLAKAAHNVFLEKEWKALWTFADLLRGRWWAQTSQPETDHSEHAAIVEAVADRDSALARDLAEKHIRLAWESVAAHFEKSVTQQGT